MTAPLNGQKWVTYESLLPFSAPVCVDPPLAGNISSLPHNGKGAGAYGDDLLLTERRRRRVVLRDALKRWKPAFCLVAEQWFASNGSLSVLFRHNQWHTHNCRDVYFYRRSPRFPPSGRGNQDLYRHHHWSESGWRLSFYSASRFRSRQQCNLRGNAWSVHHYRPGIGDFDDHFYSTFCFFLGACQRGPVIRLIQRQLFCRRKRHRCPRAERCSPQR